MEDSPYKTPGADLDSGPALKRSIFWKIYFFIITFIVAIGYLMFLFDPAVGVAEYVGIVIWLAATVGLFGFAFQKPILQPRFWLIVLLVYFIYSCTYYYLTDIDLRMDMNTGEFIVNNAIGWGISLPGYIGLYLYSRPKDMSWTSNS